MPSPGTCVKAVDGAAPSSQKGKKSDTTSSPILWSVTPSPTASTVPAPSDIGIRPSTVGIIPATTAKSWKLRSEEHTSELQSLMRISYAVFCLKKKPSKISSELQSSDMKSIKLKQNEQKIIE